MTQGYRPPRDVAERFWEKVDQTGDCWLWTAAKGPRGYGTFMVGSRTDGSRKFLAAHRFSYWLTFGVWSTPERQLHHLCRNPSCVNPDHLEVVAPRDHIYRHDGPTAQNGRLTNCRRCGQPLEGDNLVIEAGGGRRCKSCRSFWSSTYRRAARSKRKQIAGPTDHERKLAERRAHIREGLAAGKSGREIAREVGVSTACVSRIKNNRNATS